jgi:transmembrane sensor
MSRTPLTEEEFRALLKKRQEGLTSREEELFLEAFDNALELRSDITELLALSDLQQTEEEIHAAIWEKEKKLTKKKSPWRKRLAMAAVVTLALGALLPVLYKNRENKLNLTTASTYKQLEPNNFVELPDGSTVILTPGSKVRYSDSHASRPERSVFLTGEGYFDVKSDPNKPFVVYTGQVRTTAVGTAFSVKAHSKDGRIMVTVTEGKVQVHNEKKVLAVLRPNQQVIYDTRNEETFQEEVNALKVVDWKDEDLFFDDVSLETSTKILEERFGYTIKIQEDELRQKRFTATFRKQQPFLPILQSIALFNDAAVRIDSANRTAEIFLSNTP